MSNPLADIDFEDFADTMFRANQISQFECDAIKSTIDPIHRDIMVEPCVLSCGHTFDQVSLNQILRRDGRAAKCSLCNNPFTTTGRINYGTKDIIAGVKNMVLAKKSIYDTICAGSMVPPSAHAIPSTSVSPAIALPSAPILPVLPILSTTRLAVVPYEPSIQLLTSPSFSEQMIKIVSPSGPTRIPTDFCVCIDTSGSMGSSVTVTDDNGREIDDGLTTLDLTKQATRTIIESLNDTDRFALSKFSDQGEIIFPLTYMTPVAKAEAIRSLNQLRPDGNTNIWDGIQKSLDVLRTNSLGRNTALCLLTDGLPTENLSPRQGIEGALRSYMDTNSTFVCSINMIGFGYSIQSNLLNSLSNRYYGSYYFVPDGSMVGTVFIHLLANILTTIGNNLLLKVDASNNSLVACNVAYVSEAYPFIQSGNTLIFYLGNLTYGQDRTITLPSGLDISGISIQYLNTITKAPVTISTDNIAAVRRIDNDDKILEQYFRQHLIADVTNAIQKANLSQRDVGAGIVSNLIDKFRNIGIRDGTVIGDILKDITGQISQALSRNDWYEKWGKHYLVSLVRAYRVQQCNNFKDPGIQHFGGALFKEIRDAIDSIFNSLPLPTPSRNVNAYASNSRANYNQVTGNSGVNYVPPSMSSYNNTSGGCFRGDGLVRMSDGSSKRVDCIRKGDHVFGGKVMVVTKYACLHNRISLVKINNLWLTPYHPVLINGKWKFPIDVAKIEECECEYVYNFALHSGHIMSIGDVNCVTLGHGFTDNACVSHEYFGTQKVINDLKSLPGFEQGEVTIQSHQMSRDNDTGRINAISSQHTLNYDHQSGNYQSDEILVY